MGKVVPFGTNHALASSACVQDIRLWRGWLFIFRVGVMKKRESPDFKFPEVGISVCVK